ncbi:adenylate cyclase [Shewanella psychropiezotolerans]|uniref:Adenylate cyclase n=1 Tax=Shewanella psychropiezotolerans TaxID=2593655 RepID=A0ABX5X2P9_9GAMM|nr:MULTISPECIES: anthrax toxin-like adenylyl cyclase domain-containing protein [Shewanella]MPY23563.1 adenylate cyclase [Shewanella sp. YLB-07]QDO85625.1 adenylate cyclase [Shewanella psychropiezotolerans]
MINNHSVNSSPQILISNTSDKEIKPKSTTPEPLSKTDIETLFKNNNVGIPVDHAIKMQSVATDKNIIFGIRPVEAMVRQLIDESHPTKGFLVKGKSANWGPQAGFICENQQLSKRENRSQEDISKLNADVQKGKGMDYLVSDLRISKERIDELTFDLGLIEKNVDQESIIITSKGPSGKEYRFDAKQGKDGLYTIYEEYKDKPIQVLSHSISQKPLTADYDLFLTSPIIEEHGQSGLDARPNTAVVFGKPLLQGDTKSEVGPNSKPSSHSGDTSIVKGFIDKAERQIRLEQSKSDTEEQFFAREDKVMGNVSLRGRDLIDELNIQLNRGEHLEMFHHSDDAGSPVSDIRDNFPATFYLPKPLEFNSGKNKIEFKEVSVIQNRKEFSDFIRCIKDNGYHFTSNPNWGDIPSRPSFDHARELFEAKIRI